MILFSIQIIYIFGAFEICYVFNRSSVFLTLNLYLFLVTLTLIFFCSDPCPCHLVDPCLDPDLYCHDNPVPQLLSYPSQPLLADLFHSNHSDHNVLALWVAIAFFDPNPGFLIEIGTVSEPHAWEVTVILTEAFPTESKLYVMCPM